MIKLVFLLTLPLAWACGARTTLDDSQTAVDGAVADVSGDVSPTSNSCEALVLWFVGCDEERLHECEREYSAVSVSSRMAVDTAVRCLAALTSRTHGIPTWPSTAACSPATTPPIVSSNSLWFHGACEGDTGFAATTVPADPNFPPCGGDAGEPACFFGEGNSGATL